MTEDKDQIRNEPRRRHPLFGCLKGTLTVPADTDLTAPVYPDWAELLDQSSDELARLVAEGMKRPE